MARPRVKKAGRASRSALSAQRKRFVTEYLIDCDGAKAVMRAGYHCKDKHVAASCACMLLAVPEIKAAVAEAMAKRAAKVEVRAEDVLRELLRLSLVDSRKLFDEHDNFLPPSKWPTDVAACVAGIKYDKYGQPEIKLWSKPHTLELLAKHLGLLTTKVELTGKDGGPLQYENASDEELLAKAKEALEVIAKGKV
jgi:phage terminase small subunit